MILHVTRHGQPDVDDSSPAAGGRRLSTLGRDQARRLGRRLRDSGFGGRGQACIYASPYRRTMETADVIAGAAGALVAPSPPMREVVNAAGQMDAFVAQTLDELRAEYASVAPDFSLPALWWTDEVETGGDVEARVAPLLDALAEQGEDVLVVGHGASVWGAALHVLRRHAPDRMADVSGMWNCALSSFRIAPAFEVLCLADCAHMLPDCVTDNARVVAPEETAGGAS